MFKISPLQCFSEGVGSTTGHPLVECPKARYRVVVPVLLRVVPKRRDGLFMPFRCSAEMPPGVSKILFLKMLPSLPVSKLLLTKVQ